MTKSLSDNSSSIKRLDEIVDKFNFLQYELNDVKVNQNITKLVQITNPEIPANLICGMNAATGWYWYFSNTAAYVKKELARLNDEFEIWFDGMVRQQKGSSEKAKEREARVLHEKEYIARRRAIIKYEYLYDKITAAVKAFDRFIELLRSMKGLIDTEDSSRKKTL